MNTIRVDLNRWPNAQLWNSPLYPRNTIPGADNWYAPSRSNHNYPYNTTSPSTGLNTPFTYDALFPSETGVGGTLLDSPRFPGLSQPGLPDLGNQGIGSFGQGTGGFGNQGIGNFGSQGIGSIGQGIGSFGSQGIGSFGDQGIGSFGSQGIGGIGDQGIGSFGSQGIGGIGSQRVPDLGVPEVPKIPSTNFGSQFSQPPSIQTDFNLP
jgi:hypothetical protein